MPRDSGQYEPNFEYEVDELVRYYKRALREIQNELRRIDLNEFQRANLNAVLSDISEILIELDETVRDWIDRNIEKASIDGIAAALVDLGIAATIADARRIVKFNRLNRELVKAVVADTYENLLAVTQNIDRRVRATVRRVTAEVLRSNFTRGISGNRANRREILANLRKELGSAIDTGIIDAAGRRWKPEVYVDMVTRTKLMEAHLEARINEGIARGAYYGRISAHGAKDACRFHEGRIVKLTADAPGDYPTMDSLRGSNQIFHPNCKHVVTILSDPALLPESVRKLAEQQARLGDAALATGKANPKETDLNLI
jgi:hypothetical protein